MRPRMTAFPWRAGGTREGENLYPYGRLLAFDPSGENAHRRLGDEAVLASIPAGIPEVHPIRHFQAQFSELITRGRLALEAAVRPQRSTHGRKESHQEA